MIFELETAVKTKLESITNFQAVYDHYTLNTSWYPYAAFELSSFDWSFLSVCANERDFTFNIIVIQEVNKNTLTRDAAKNIVYKCLEQIVEKFDWDQDLWEWTIVRWNVSSWDMGTIQDKEWSVIALSIKLTLTILTQAWA